MSIECLNDDERATYFLGLAVRRQMEEARDNFASSGKSDPKSKKAFNSIFRWTKRWLPPDKIDNISASTGYVIRKEFQRELSRTSAQGRKFNPVKASTDAGRGMSIKRLNGDERATYFLGLAVRWQMEEARDNVAATGKSDPKSKKAFNSIFRWTERWLDPDDIDNISASTGYFIRKEFQDEMLCLGKYADRERPSRPDRRAPAKRRAALN
jgi:hypothetical protein